ncbi:hypothetical protein H310_10135 [Aphanomyces invadans]|uniref:Uncharacterized protein n=1 Tax=Aphanomyces invadans TaxID=157072 RepID=A0A024TRT5_9STRA|nr:hypothetical protein H310_10135 [Aphanomyces invadans]ETV96850.1 hypothetical protein H310_10135 [Aphanomyces invadans]|eukprot:XP_008874627.1 hypothetical protein H310_10135 [Aphanomyces invadans]
MLDETKCHAALRGHPNTAIVEELREMLRREPTRLDVKEDLEEEIDEYHRREAAQRHQQPKRALAKQPRDHASFHDEFSSISHVSSHLRPSTSMRHDTPST